MAYLRRTAEVRKDVRRQFPWARSIVMLAAQHPGEKADRGLGRHIARYAQGDDYHDVLDAPLRELEEFIQQDSSRLTGAVAQTRRYIDTGPIPEKSFAAEAGLGWMGKNTLILNESYGSYFLLADILTDLDLPPDPPAVERCGSCTLCLESCPTGAFAAPYVLDSTKCISYHTIETKTDLPPTISEHLEGNLFGCDICQEVCPWNKSKGGETRFQPRPAYRAIEPANLREMSVEAFRSAFKGSPLKRPGLDKLRLTAQHIPRG